MKITRNIILGILSTIFFAIAILLSPYAERYEGMSGYIYEYGAIYEIVCVLLLILALIFISSFCIDTIRRDEKE